MEENAIQILKKLVQTPSLSGQEEEVSNVVVEILGNSASNPIKDNGNIYLHLKGSDSKRALIFNAHLDTVDAGDKSLWRFPPYGKGAGVIEKGKLYGLGASDAKASITALILLSKKFKQRKPPIDVWLTFVVKEEVDGSGTKKFMEWFKNQGYYGRYFSTWACLGEPTNLEKVEIGHRGDAFLSIKTHGETGHSARPDGVKHQAVWKMLHVLSKLKEFSCLLKTSRKFRDEFFPLPSLCVTGVHTPKGARNKIPSMCEIVVDVRTTPALDDVLLSELKECLNGDSIEINHLKLPSKSVKTGINSEIVKVIKQVLPKAHLVAAIGANDMGTFVRNGIPAIVLGPGLKETIHKENEHADIKKVVRCVDIYKKLVYSL